jgi:hypothetical protein
MLGCSSALENVLNNTILVSMSMRFDQFKSGRASLSLMVSGVLISLIAQLLLAAPAKSQQCPTCEYNGTCYEAGETVGPFICGADGSWHRND